MNYTEQRINQFDLLTYSTERGTTVILLYEGCPCDEFPAAVTGVPFKNGLLIQPTRGKEGFNNRTYYFYNNNGDRVFHTKRKMNESKTEFVENLSLYENKGNITFLKTHVNGDIVSKTINIATNAEVMPGQISLF